jgi:hypothetical protein
LICSLDEAVPASGFTGFSSMTAHNPGADLAKIPRFHLYFDIRRLSPAALWKLLNSCA